MDGERPKELVEQSEKPLFFQRPATEDEKGRELVG